MSVDAALLEVLSTVHNSEQFRPFSPFGSLNINLWWLFTYVIHLYIALSLFDWFRNTFWPEWWNLYKISTSGGDLPEVPASLSNFGTELPKHVAIIMDGNRRWATSRHLPKIMGHKAGVESLERIIVAASKIGLRHITVYAFSTENWKRSREEVEGLLNLLRDYLKTRKAKAKQNQDDIRIHFIGEPSAMPEDIQREMIKVEKKSAKKKGTCVHIAFNYGGRDEIVRAVQRLGAAAAEGKVDLTKKLSEAEFAKYLDTKDVPDPDLLIRTSSEKRLSNFLLWELAYAEFAFCDKLWPDFTGEDLQVCVRQFMDRQRRLGK